MNEINALKYRIEVLEKATLAQNLINTSLHEWIMSAMEILKELRNDINLIKNTEEWR